MFCAKCGANIEQPASFCPACGNASVATTAPTPQKKLTPALTKVLVFLGFLFVVVIVGKMLSTHTQEEDSQRSQKQDDSSSAQASDVRYKVGEDVHVGYWAYRCETAKWQNTYFTHNLYYHALTGAKFLVVSLSFRNNDKSSSALPPAQLVDDAGREFDMSSEYGLSSFVSLNPDLTSNGNLVFEVPPGSTS